MDIDPTFKGILIPWFSTLQPQDPSHDWIPPWSIRLEDFAGRSPGMKDLTQWLPRSDFHSNKKPSKRCGIASEAITDSKSGSGDGIMSLSFSILFQH